MNMVVRERKRPFPSAPWGRPFHPGATSASFRREISAPIGQADGVLIITLCEMPLPPHFKYLRLSAPRRVAPAVKASLVIHYFNPAVTSVGFKPEEFVVAAVDGIADASRR